jgi:hypothetical protein
MYKASVPCDRTSVAPVRTARRVQVGRYDSTPIFPRLVAIFSLVFRRCTSRESVLYRREYLEYIEPLQYLRETIVMMQ